MPRKTVAQLKAEFQKKHKGDLGGMGVTAPSQPGREGPQWTVVALPTHIADLVSVGGIPYEVWVDLQENNDCNLSGKWKLMLPTPLYEKDEHCSHCGFDLKADALCKTAKIPIQGGDCANAECPESKGFIPEFRKVNGAVPGQIVVQMNYDSTGLNEDWRNVKEDFNPTGDRRRRRMPREWELKYNNGRLSINPVTGFTILEDYDETLRQWNLEIQAKDLAKVKAAAAVSQVRQTIVMDARPKKKTRKLPPMRRNNRRNTDQVIAEVEGLDEVPVETSLEDELAKFQAENQIR